MATGLICLGPGLLAAGTLEMPRNATLAAQSATPLTSHRFATAGYADGYVPHLLLEGAVTVQAWQIASPGLTTLQMLAPLRAQLQQAGFVVLYECETQVCGGYDFRYAIEVLPPPAMHVDLGDFRYLCATRTTAEGAAEHLSLLVSRTSNTGFVQITRIGDRATTADVAVTGAAALRGTTEPADAAAGAMASGDVATQLDTTGRAVLPDLVFETGSAQLGPGPFAALDALAAYLRDNPTRQVALVGHTDSSGSLDINIALSKRRAGSVLERLVSDYGIPRSQLAAEGMGYLSPLASNLTPEGRDANRRVEVIVTSTQ